VGAQASARIGPLLHPQNLPHAMTQNFKIIRDLPAIEHGVKYPG
jgi:hypothetical protein